MTEVLGHPALAQHLQAVIGLTCGRRLYGRLPQLGVFPGEAGHLIFQGVIDLLEFVILGEGLGQEAGVVGYEFKTLDGALDGGEEFFARPGLDHETVDFSFVDGVDQGGEIEDGGDENAGGVGLDLTDLGQKLQTGNHGHLLVGDDDGELLFLENTQGMDGMGRGDNVVTFVQQGVAQGDQDDFLVIDNQDRAGRVVGCVQVLRHGISAVLVKKGFELQQQVGFGQVGIEKQIDAVEQLGIQIVLVAAGGFQDEFDVFILLADLGGQGVQSRIVGLGEDENAVEMIVGGLQQLGQTVGRSGGDDLVIVGAEQFGGFIEDFAGQAQEQEVAAGLALAGGGFFEAAGFREVGFRQPDLETRAGTLPGGNGNGALEFFDGEAGVVKAQAGTFGFGGEKRVKDGGQMALFDAAAGVFNGQANAREARGGAFHVFQSGQCLVAGGAQGQAPAARHGIGGVQEQIDDDLAELDDIEIGREPEGGQLGGQLDAAGQDFGDQVHEVAGDVIQIMIIALADLAEVEVDHAFDQLAGLQ